MADIDPGRADTVAKRVGGAALPVDQVGGLLYAPDYVINAGGAIAIVGLEQLGWNRSELDTALARIGETLPEIYERPPREASRRQQPPTLLPRTCRFVCAYRRSQ